MHSLIHYIRIIELIGPVIHFSTLKFERKNKKLKEAVAGTTSNVNLPLTIINRLLLQLSYDIDYNPINNKDYALGEI